MKNQKGFSLVELMVVVAIIGILMAIGSTNYQGFQRKAKHSEGLSLLGSLYTYELAFQSETTNYTGYFADIGFVPNGKLTYRVGFSGPGLPLPVPTQSATIGAATETDGCGSMGPLTTSCTKSANWPTALTGSTPPAASTAVLPAKFTAAANGLIGGAVEDRMTINEVKNVNQTVPPAQDGTK